MSVSSYKIITILSFLIIFDSYAAEYNVNVNINSAGDAVSYIQTAYAIGLGKSCWKNNSPKKEVASFMTDGVISSGNDKEIYKRIVELQLYNCIMLKEVINTVFRNKAVILDKYPNLIGSKPSILSVDKNSAAHNVMVGNAKKGKWVVCYGLSKSGTPLAKQSSLVKNKYTIVNVSSRTYHDKIVSYECEYEG